MNATRTPWSLLVVSLALSCAAGNDVSVPIDAVSEVSADDVADVVTAGEVVLDDVTTTDVIDVPLALDGVTPDAPATGDVSDVAPIDAGSFDDSLPTETVMYFTGTTCPRGWTPHHDVVGRVAVATERGVMAGVTRGAPLRDREERTHTHSMLVRFLVEAIQFAGIAGGANRGVAASGEVMFNATTSPTNAGLPYVQLLVCRKTAPPVARTTTLPAGMMIFFAGAHCPDGFSQSTMSAGRAVVGTPPGGEHGATVGSLFTGAARHHHDVTATLATSAHGIALASGCCAMNYARNATFRSMVPTSDDDGALPTVTMLHCQKD
jgi:hypothetical protein